MALTGNRLSLNRLPADATHKRKTGRSGAWNGPLCVSRKPALRGKTGRTDTRLGFCQVSGAKGQKESRCQYVCEKKPPPTRIASRPLRHGPWATKKAKEPRRRAAAAAARRLGSVTTFNHLTT